MHTLHKMCYTKCVTHFVLEEKLYQPGARSFLQQYQLGTPSNTKRSIESLMEKEMIYQDRDEQGDYYQVYDCFLARWLQQS